MQFSYSGRFFLALDILKFNFLFKSGKSGISMSSEVLNVPTNGKSRGSVLLKQCLPQKCNMNIYII